MQHILKQDSRVNPASCGRWINTLKKLETVKPSLVSVVHVSKPHYNWRQMTYSCMFECLFKRSFSLISLQSLCLETTKCARGVVHWSRRWGVRAPLGEFLWLLPICCFYFVIKSSRIACVAYAITAVQDNRFLLLQSSQSVFVCVYIYICMYVCACVLNHCHTAIRLEGNTFLSECILRIKINRL